MRFSASLKNRFPSLYKFLASIYRTTPLYDSALAKVLKERVQKETIYLKELFKGDYTIRQGPFEGMHYLPNASGSMILPKILGSYENALIPWIEDALHANYETIIDVGCAEGYYAVGLARNQQVTQVYAYDLDPEARERTLKLAEQNGLADRLTLGEQCDWQELAKVVKGRTFILCDIEGAERELLDPSRCPELARCDLVVEMHDFLVPGVTEEIKKRFQSTHKIECIKEQARRPEEYPLLSGLSRDEQDFILDEHRPSDMKWLRMTSLSR